MESPAALHDLAQTSREMRRLRAWRVERLRNLGVPFVLAELFGDRPDRLDWHALEDLIDRGCPLDLALEILL
ncbi:MAG TPA: hypothetical protein VH063_02260 [Gaiellaceae bacterium]|jgi:hypothetical protein|nr:hypothetical protein [Gaiellaceae bacterium]